MRQTLASDITPQEIVKRARRDYDLVRAELLRLAREDWSELCPGQPLPESDDETIRQVLDAVARQHPQPDELIEVNRAELERIEEFCRSRNLIRLPDEPLQITWTPVFMRAYGRAFLQSPGPLDKGLPSYFWITPPDESLGPEAVESYLREDNDRMNVLLAIHEGVPGHYLQGAYANESDSLARAVFASGTFAEGWAVYVTQVMMDLGYRDNEPALWMTHWKFYLRAITNAIMDVAIHTEEMTEEQAMELMVGGGFQEHDEARAKWLRARISSTQLVDLLRRVARNVGPGGRESPPSSCRVRGRRRVGATSTHRRRHGRDARVRLSRAPRGSDLARHAADQVGPAPDVRRTPDDGFRPHPSLVPRRSEHGIHRCIV